MWNQFRHRIVSALPPPYAQGLELLFDFFKRVLFGKPDG
jgi:hypothetical protein